MAAAAGVVNVDGPDDDAAFRRILEPFSGDISALAVAVRRLIYDVLPTTVEVVWPTQRSVGWGLGPKKFSEQFAYLMPYARHVTLGFYHAGDLPDPDGLLPDRGGKQVGGTLSMRSLKITTPDQVSRPALRALIEAATADQAARLSAPDQD